MSSSRTPSLTRSEATCALTPVIIVCAPSRRTERTVLMRCAAVYVSTTVQPVMSTSTTRAPSARTASRSAADICAGRWSSRVPTRGTKSTPRQLSTTGLESSVILMRCCRCSSARPPASRPRTRDFAAARGPLVETKLSGFLSGILFRECRRIHGENDIEGRALPFGARHLDATAVVAHDVLRDPEAEARALRPRREERLEDARDVGFGDAAPRVAYLHGDGWLQGLFVERGAYAYAPALLHRLLRVQQKVQADLSQLVAARANLRQPRVEPADGLDARLPHLL